MDNSHLPSLAEFIIAAIEEAAPQLNGREIYQRGFDRFTEYCANRHRAATAAQLAKHPPPSPLRTVRRVTRPRG